MMVILPFLHLGQHNISWPVNRNIISRTVSFLICGGIASGAISFRISRIDCFLFLCDKNPKYRIFIKLCGSTWSRNLRINSWPGTVIVFIVSLSVLSLYSKLTFPFSTDWIRLFDMATLWVSGPSHHQITCYQGQLWTLSGCPADRFGPTAGGFEWSAPTIGLLCFFEPQICKPLKSISTLFVYRLDWSIFLWLPPDLLGFFFKNQQSCGFC